MPALPERIADRAGADEQAVRAMVTRDTFRRSSWGGDRPEPAFWHHAGIVPPSAALRDEMLDLHLLVPPERIAGWRMEADIWVVSNHRHERLLPALARHGLDEVVGRIEVSSLTGRVKPDPATWTGEVDVWLAGLR